MADVTVSVTGLQAIVNPTTWNASRMGWGQGMYNTGGYVDENILQGWGHPAWGQVGRTDRHIRFRVCHSDSRWPRWARRNTWPR